MSFSSGAVAWQALEEIRHDIEGYMRTVTSSASSSSFSVRCAGDANEAAALSANEAAALRQRVARLEHELQEEKKKSSSSPPPSSSATPTVSVLALAGSKRPRVEDEDEDEGGREGGREGGKASSTSLSPSFSGLMKVEDEARVKRLERQLEEERLLRASDAERARSEIEAQAHALEKAARQIKFLMGEEEVARAELRDSVSRNAQDRQRLHEQLRDRGRQIDALEAQLRDALSQASRPSSLPSSSSSSSSSRLEEMQAALRKANEELTGKKALEMQVESLQRQLTDTQRSLVLLEAKEDARPDNDAMLKKLMAQSVESERSLKRVRGEMERLTAERANTALLRERIEDLEHGKARLEQRLSAFQEKEGARAVVEQEQEEEEKEWELLLRQVGASTEESEKRGGGGGGEGGGGGGRRAARVFALIRRLQEKEALAYAQVGEKEVKCAALERSLQASQASVAEQTVTLASLQEEVTLLQERVRASDPYTAALQRENATYKNLLDRSYEHKSRQGEEGGKEGGKEGGEEKQRIVYLEEMLANALSSLKEMEGKQAALASPLILSNLQARLSSLTSALEREEREKEGWKEEAKKKEQRLSKMEGELAGLESRVAKGEDVKILHFKENPTVLFLRSETLTARQEAEGLKKQVAALQQQQQQLQQQQQQHMSMSSASSLGGDEMDSSKYHQRLKEAFKQRINLFRDCCYQLTGYMITLSTDREFPQVTLRSMYAESQEDCLLFQWRGETLEMLETAFTKHKLRASLLDTLRRYNSLPLFLAGITQELFETSTMH